MTKQSGSESWNGFFSKAFQKRSLSFLARITGRSSIWPGMHPPDWGFVAVDNFTRLIPNLVSEGLELSHEKNTLTFHYTGWLIGILIIVYDDPYVIGCDFIPYIP